MPIVYPNRYPNLQGIMDLFRSKINDDGSGTDGPQGGIIATNAAPFTLPFLNEATRDVFSDLRNVGDPALVLDNYLLLGLPALTQPDPAVQVSLGFLGYFDGFANHAQWTLPSGLMNLDRVWERQSGVGPLDFYPMASATGGLEPRQQDVRMRQYEWRGNAMWMPGALEAVDLRMRCKITLPDVLGTNIDFTNTYIPILNCANAVTTRMLMSYADRFSPEQSTLAETRYNTSLQRLRLEIVRAKQSGVVMRRDFGEEAVSSFSQWNNNL